MDDDNINYIHVSILKLSVGSQPKAVGGRSEEIWLTFGGFKFKLKQHALQKLRTPIVCLFGRLCMHEAGRFKEA